jgi:hypothetical protein
LDHRFTRQPPSAYNAGVVVSHKDLSCGFCTDPINRTSALWISPQVVQAGSLNPSSVGIRSDETDHDPSICWRHSFQRFPAERPCSFRFRIVCDGFPVAIPAIFGSHRSNMNQDIVKEL